MNPSFPFNDPSLPLPERLADLLSRLSPDEKLGLMASRQEAILRLGLGEYHIGGEAAHGLQSAEGCSTSFPQTLGLAASWDEELLEQAGAVVADEARAYYNKRSRLGGLSLWAPTVDMERDPRWGRTEEAYGEDPRLGGRLSSAYVRGMMGHEPFYLKAAPTPKHFFGNNNERGRCSSSSSIDPRNEREYYLAAFEPALAEAGAPSLMTAYNAVNGRPAMVRSELSEILRGEWGFSGFVVCDAGSLPMLVSEHRAFPDLAEAAAASVKAGIDNFSDDAAIVRPALAEALNRGLLSWSDIDRSLGRCLGVRFRLGQFDPQGRCPYDAIGESVLWSRSHRELALRAAREAVVLLENSAPEGGDLPILPLAPGRGARLALIGPLAAEVYRDWYGATPFYKTSPLAAFSARLGPESVAFDDGCDLVSLTAPDGRGLGSVSWFDSSLAADRPSGRGGELLRRCDWGWGNQSFRSLVNGRYLTTDDEKVELKAAEVWGWYVRERFALEPALLDARPDAAYFKTWKGEYLGLDEGRRLVVLSGDRGPENRAAAATAAQANAEPPKARLSGRPSEAVPLVVSVESEGRARAASLAAGAETAIVFVGNNPLLVAKEEIDREDIRLPPEQERLIEAVLAANPRTVVVVIGSYPFALGAWKDRAAAVIYSAHGGQEAGNAIADVVLGAYNPAGRLPMTWYRDLGQIGGILDYDIMRGKRTYRWFEGEPQYPFGYGLSFSRFEYSQEGDPEGDGSGGYALRVRVTNASGPAGEEVLQLYGSCGKSAVRRPRAQLFDFKRLALPAGGSSVVELRARAEDFSFWDLRSGSWFRESGDWELRLSASSADTRLRIPLRIEGESLPPRAIGTWTSALSYDDASGAVLDWSPVGEIVRAAEGSSSALLRFEDLDFGPGGKGFAELLCPLSRPGAGLSLFLEGCEPKRLEAEGSGECSLRLALELPAGRRALELGLDAGLGLSSFRLVRS